jgi:hypothetical protein
MHECGGFLVPGLVPGRAGIPGRPPYGATAAPERSDQRGYRCRTSGVVDRDLTKPAHGEGGELLVKPPRLRAERLLSIVRRACFPVVAASGVPLTSTLSLRMTNSGTRTTSFAPRHGRSSTTSRGRRRPALPGRPGSARPCSRPRERPRGSCWESAGGSSLSSRRSGSREMRRPPPAAPRCCRRCPLSGKNVEVARHPPGSVPGEPRSRIRGPAGPPGPTGKPGPPGPRGPKGDRGPRDPAQGIGNV